MGCCGSCSLGSHGGRFPSSLPVEAKLARLGLEGVPELLLNSPASSKSSTTDGTPSDTQKESAEDDKVAEIESFVTELIETAQWKLHVNDENCEVKSCTRGMSSSGAPVLFLKIDFETESELEAVWRILYDPATRMRWDKGLLCLDEIQLSNNAWTIYCATKMPFPMKNRDFTERRVVKELPNRLITFHYSIPEDAGGAPRSEKYERAEELFSFARLERTAGRTRMLLVSQNDLKLPIPQNKIDVVAASQLKNWAKLLKHEVMQLDNQV